MSTYKIDKYKEALEAIAKASDQANAIHLKVVSQTALDFEPTTADELHKEYEEADPTEAELAEYDKRLSEEAESAWRGTVLHPNYKSKYDEEE